MLAALAYLQRVLRESLTALGQVWFFIPAPPPVPPAPPPGPAPGHPERLRPDVPLTDQEEALSRELKDIALPDPIGEEKGPGA